ncbi:MAG: RDD family protein, partial [Solirubrobacterales bacterium]
MSAEPKARRRLPRVWPVRTDAGRWCRTFAATLDGLVALLAAFAGAIAAGIVGSVTSETVGVALTAIVAPLAAVAAYPAMLLIRSSPPGQTVGKQLLNIRIIDPQARPAGVRGGLARGVSFCLLLGALAVALADEPPVLLAVLVA